MRKLAVAVVLGAALAGCMPAKRLVPDGAKAEVLQEWRSGQPRACAVDAQWWQVFGDEHLTAMIEKALRNNGDVLIAATRVAEAHAAVRDVRAGLWPSLSADVGGGYSRTLSEVTGKPEYTVAAQPELTAAWEIDVFGRLRDQRDAAKLAYKATQADYDAVQLAVAAQVATSYITLMSLDAQLEISQRTLDSRVNALKIAKSKAASGYASELELTQAEAEYEAVAQAVPQLERTISTQENALARLVGDAPHGIARQKLVDMALPQVPGMLPSDLLSRRPDLAQAELQLAASDETLAARRANFLPSVRLSASMGKLLVNGLDYDPVAVFDTGASVLVPVFTAGRLDAQYDAATAQRDRAAYGYRAVVLKAFGEVDNALNDSYKLAEQQEHMVKRRDILRVTLRHAHERYTEGYAPYLDELDAQRNVFAAELDAVRIQEALLTNRIDLYRVMGGGWGWMRPNN